MTIPPDPQCARAALMIRPVRFLSNPETRASNAFQTREATLAASEQQTRALAEFEGLVQALTAAGVQVYVFDDTPEPHTPDAIFPNNWVSFHPCGRVVLYPMMAENRRLERRCDVLDALVETHGLQLRERLDLSGHEAEGRYLEGTGSMVLDRVHRVAYACRSARTHDAVLDDFARRLDFSVMAFDAVGPDGTPIYHTNVLMSVGDGFAVVCAEAIADPHERQAVLTRLQDTGRDLVTLSFDQMAAFAGNMLALRDQEGRQVLAMSSRAEASLTDAQRKTLTRHARLVSAPIPTIEDHAGGSVRCMLAEVFLPH